jgi:hypothetical protein
MKFEELYNTNVNGFIEQKGKFNYLSWTYAVKELKKAFPEATYQQIYNGCSPYFKDDSGCYVKIKLWLTKEDRKDDFYQDFNHPVLDNQNKTIYEPNNFEVNTSFMRGLTKLIGMATGIGLYIYAGEDLPPNEPTKAELEAQEKANKEAEIEAYYSKVESYCRNEAPKDYVNAYYTAIHNKYISKAPKLKDDKRFNDLVEKHKPEIKEPSNKFEDALNSSKKIVVGV